MIQGRAVMLWGALAVGCGGGQPPAAAQNVDSAPVRAGVRAWGVAPVDPLASDLAEAERARDPAHPALVAGLASDDPVAREAAAWSLARIGGPRALEGLRSLLDRDLSGDMAGVYAAFGLLEPPRQAAREAAEPEGAWAGLEDALWARYAATEDPTAAEALLFAIGRVGGSRSMIRLAADLRPRPSEEAATRHGWAMEAAAILCARGHSLTARGLEAVAQGIDLTNPDARRAAVYALGRCVAPSAELVAGERSKVMAERVGRLLDGGDDETVRLAWKALGALGELPERVDFGLAEDRPHWTASVEAARALAGSARGRELLADRLGNNLPGRALVPPQAHFIHTALRSLRPHVTSTPELVDTLRPMLQRLDGVETDEPDRRRAVTLARCELLALLAINSGNTDELEACTADDELAPAYVDALVVEVLLLMGDAMLREERIDRLLAWAADPSDTRAIPALSALAELDDARVNETLRAALARDDVGRVSAAAGAVAARSLDASKRDPEAVGALTAALGRLTNEQAVEARIAAVEALGRLARTARVGQTPDLAGAGGPEPAPDAPWLDAVERLATDPAVAVRSAAREALQGHPDRVARFDAVVPPVPETPFTAASDALKADPGHGLRLETSRGVVEIEAIAGLAPMNRASLAHLARSGYFDGLTFHRVVAGFVTQGGDPRGDGYGGPGYLVPCEWSNVRYERGTVGIALAGKDTGGSQLFIAHTPQPHLDGRYTVVGRVVKGMEVVDRVLPHDRIERVTVLDNTR